MFIKPIGSVGELLKPDMLSVEFKESGITAMGLLIDANGDPVSRWNQIRHACNALVSDLPEQLPADGLIIDSITPRFGVWMMPDNVSTGMLETFLLYLVPDQNDALYTHAVKSRDEAKQLNAPFKDTHHDKALIHTWLAWQDPPGQQLHGAIIQNILQSTSLHAQPFVQWFRRLYQV